MMSRVPFYINVAAIAAIKGRQQEGNLGGKKKGFSIYFSLSAHTRKTKPTKQKTVNDTLAV